LGIAFYREMSTVVIAANMVPNQTALGEDSADIGFQCKIHRFIDVGDAVAKIDDRIDVRVSSTLEAGGEQIERTRPLLHERYPPVMDVTNYSKAHDEAPLFFIISQHDAAGDLERPAPCL
jgi:hypothetical protein